jgi:predicted transcriptional regulator
MEKMTTVQLSVKTRNELEKLKMSERDTFDDVINMLIEDNMEVNAETRKDIDAAAREEKEGRVVPHEEVKKRFGLK